MSMFKDRQFASLIVIKKIKLIKIVSFIFKSFKNSFQYLILALNKQKVLKQDEFYQQTEVNFSQVIAFYIKKILRPKFHPLLLFFLSMKNRQNVLHIKCVTK